MKRFIALLASLFLITSVAVADKTISGVYTDVIIKLMNDNDMEIEDLQLIIDAAEKLIKEKQGIADPVSQPVGIDGTWITTEIKIADLSVTGLSEDEAKRQMDEANQQVASGLVIQTLVFADGKAIFTQKLDGAITGSTEPTENVATGTYTLDGNQITMKLESEGVTAPDMVAILNGNQIEWELSGVTMIFTRSEVSNRTNDKKSYIRETQMKSVYVEEIPLTISIPEDMKVFTKEDRKVIGYGADNWKFYAKSADGKLCAHVKVINENQTFDMSVLNTLSKEEKEQIMQMLGSMLEQQYGFVLQKSDILTINNVIYVLSELSATNLGVSFVEVSYVTVVNQKMFEIGFEVSADDNGLYSDELDLIIREIVNSVEY